MENKKVIDCVCCGNKTLSQGEYCSKCDKIAEGISQELYEKEGYDFTKDPVFKEKANRLCYVGKDDDVKWAMIKADMNAEKHRGYKCAYCDTIILAKFEENWGGEKLLMPNYFCGK